MAFSKICHKIISAPKCYFRTFPFPFQRSNLFPLPWTWVCMIATANKLGKKWCFCNFWGQVSRRTCLLLDSPFLGMLSSRTQPLTVRNVRNSRFHEEDTGRSGNINCQRCEWASNSWFQSPAQPFYPLPEALNVLVSNSLDCVLTEFLTHRICKHNKWTFYATNFWNV